MCGEAGRHAPEEQVEWAAAGVGAGTFNAHSPASHYWTQEFLWPIFKCSEHIFYKYIYTHIYTCAYFMFAYWNVTFTPLGNSAGVAKKGYEHINSRFYVFNLGKWNFGAGQMDLMLTGKPIWLIVSCCKCDFIMNQLIVAFVPIPPY